MLSPEGWNLIVYTIAICFPLACIVVPWKRKRAVKIFAITAVSAGLVDFLVYHLLFPVNPPPHDYDATAFNHRISFYLINVLLNGGLLMLAILLRALKVGKK